MILNSIFKDVVSVNADEVFDGCEFNVQGQSSTDVATPGVKILGGNVVIQNSTFANKGYSAVNYKTGHITLKNNLFKCSVNGAVMVKNPIEGLYKAEGALVDNMIIENNIFDGKCGNNYINFYQFKDGAKIVLKGNQIKNADLNAEMVRISNTNNAKNVSFEIENETYNWIAGDATQWTSYLLYEDDSTAGKAEDYTGININIKNLMCDGEKITGLVDGNSRKRVQLMYRPDNGGILAMPDSNNPAITIQ